MSVGRGASQWGRGGSFLKNRRKIVGLDGQDPRVGYVFMDYV